MQIIFTVSTRCILCLGILLVIKSYIETTVDYRHGTRSVERIIARERNQLRELSRGKEISWENYREGTRSVERIIARGRNQLRELSRWNEISWGIIAREEISWENYRDGTKLVERITARERDQLRELYFLFQLFIILVCFIGVYL